jgi:YVTN family beta-propeller protein
VANYYSNELTVIDRATYGVNNIGTAAGPRRLAISPNADRIYQ